MNCKGFEPLGFCRTPPYPWKKHFFVCVILRLEVSFFCIRESPPIRCTLQCVVTCSVLRLYEIPLAHQSPYSNNCPFSCYQFLLGVLNVLHGKRSSFTDNPCVDVPYLQYRQCNTGFLLSFGNGKRIKTRNPAKGGELLQGIYVELLRVSFPKCPLSSPLDCDANILFF